jgi:hypothetical protein
MPTTDSAAVRAEADDAATPRPQLLFVYSRTSGSSRRAEGFLAQVLQRRRNHNSFRLIRSRSSSTQTSSNASASRTSPPPSSSPTNACAPG